MNTFSNHIRNLWLCTAFSVAAISSMHSKYISLVSFSCSLRITDKPNSTFGSSCTNQQTHASGSSHRNSAKQPAIVYFTPSKVNNVGSNITIREGSTSRGNASLIVMSASTMTIGGVSISSGTLSTVKATSRGANPISGAMRSRWAAISTGEYCDLPEVSSLLHIDEVADIMCGTFSALSRVFQKSSRSFTLSLHTLPTGLNTQFLTLVSLLTAVCAIVYFLFGNAVGYGHVRVCPTNFPRVAHGLQTLYSIPTISYPTCDQ
mmetsp:Transcript_1220/g.2151  ORF Transcript_1220/g.2151 Transcript_1220/m.2151 type:complete len:262 (-) Transcript_1220:3-788(-)